MAAWALVFVPEPIIPAAVDAGAATTNQYVHARRRAAELVLSGQNLG
jgi:hypothetical protein